MKKILILLFISLLCGCSKDVLMTDLSNMSLNEIETYASENNLELNKEYTYSDIEKDKVVSQSIPVGTKLSGQKLDIVISKGKNDTYKLSLAMVGDVLIHGSVYGDAKTNNGYDFTEMVGLVKPLIADYDLAYYNQETILGGVELGLSTYPRFNSPYEVGDAMLDMGFNLVSLANNHTLDRNEEGIINSVAYWKKQENVLVAGSYTSQEDRDNMDIHIGEKNGITYGFLSYTTATNGLKAPYGKEYLVNVYSDELVKKDIEAIRDKVDVLIVAMHWGSEYTHTPTYEETSIANYLASLDVDLIIGNHPHVIQPITYIDDTLVIYSLGNFLSGQIGEERNIGLLASVDITKTVDNDGTKITIDNIGTELIYTKYNMYVANDNYYCSKYELYPFSDLNNSILNNYLSIEEKYNKIVTEYDNTIKVNMFSDNEVKS